jgi:hypothetical protein
MRLAKYGRSQALTFTKMGPYRPDKHFSEILPQLQLEVLQNAASSEREGGRLVYSTCSFDYGQ